MGELWGVIADWFSSAGAPAWVQGIGSVVAIFVALRLANDQKQTEMDNAELTRLIQARGFATELLASVETAIENGNFQRAEAALAAAKNDPEKWVTESKSIFDSFALYLPDIGLTSEYLSAFMGQAEVIHQHRLAVKNYRVVASEVDSLLHDARLIELFKKYRPGQEPKALRETEVQKNAREIAEQCHRGAKELVGSFSALRGMLSIHAMGFHVRRSDRYRETIPGPKMKPTWFERLAPKWLLFRLQERRQLRRVLKADDVKSKKR